MAMTQCQTPGCTERWTHETIGGPRLCRRCYLGQASRALQDLPPMDPRDTVCPGCGQLVPFILPAHAAVAIDATEQRWHVPCYLHHLDPQRFLAPSPNQLRILYQPKPAADGPIRIDVAVTKDGIPYIPKESNAEAMAKLEQVAALDACTQPVLIGDTKYAALFQVPGANVEHTAFRCDATAAVQIAYRVRFGEGPDVPKGTALLLAWLRQGQQFHGSIRYHTGGSQFTIRDPSSVQPHFQFPNWTVVRWTETPRVAQDPIVLDTIVQAGDAPPTTDSASGVNAPPLPSATSSETNGNGGGAPGVCELQEDTALRHALTYAKIAMQQLDRGDRSLQALFMVRVASRQFDRAAVMWEAAGKSALTPRRAALFFQKSLMEKFGDRLAQTQHAYDLFEHAKAFARSVVRAPHYSKTVLMAEVRKVQSKFDAAKTAAVDAELNLSFIHDAEREFAKCVSVARDALTVVPPADASAGH